jgi:hypothetical protein
MTAILGIIVAILVDAALPAVLAIVLIRRNRSRRTSDRSEKTFWIIAGVYTGGVALIAAAAVRDVFAFEGATVVVLTVLAGPSGLLPAIFNSNVIHYFFTDAEWAAIGYHPVLIAYVIGMVAWAFLNAAGLRALISLGRRRPEPVPAS